MLHYDCHYGGLPYLETSDMYLRYVHTGLCLIMYVFPLMEADSSSICYLTHFKQLNSTIGLICFTQA